MTLPDRVAKALSSAPTIRRSFRHMRKDCAAIVMYHGIVSQKMETENWCQLHVDAFDEQLTFLQENYTVVSLREIAEQIVTGKSLPDNAVAITFDDAFRSIATLAYPLLKARSMRATVFVVTANSDSRQPAWPDKLFSAIQTTHKAELSFEGAVFGLRSGPEKSSSYANINRTLKTMNAERAMECFEALLDQLMPFEAIAPGGVFATLSWNEIEHLSKEGLLEFGSHTHTHRILSRCSLDVQRLELRRSRDLLRDHGCAADLFAYPNGTPEDFSAATKRLLQELGYKCAVSSIPGLNELGTDRYELRRVPVGADTTIEMFGMRMAGL